jgi:hypothetical protein
VRASKRARKAKSQEGSKISPMREAVMHFLVPSVFAQRGIVHFANQSAF